MCILANLVKADGVSDDILSIYLSINLSTVSIYSSIYPSIYSIYSIHLLSIYPFIHVSIYLSSYRSIYHEAIWRRATVPCRAVPCGAVPRSSQPVSVGDQKRLGLWTIDIQLRVRVKPDHLNSSALVKPDHETLCTTMVFVAPPMREYARHDMTWYAWKIASVMKHVQILRELDTHATGWHSSCFHSNPQQLKALGGAAFRRDAGHINHDEMDDHLTHGGQESHDKRARKDGRKEGLKWPTTKEETRTDYPPRPLDDIQPHLNLIEEIMVRTSCDHVDSKFATIEAIGKSTCRTYSEYN